LPCTYHTNQFDLHFSTPPFLKSKEAFSDTFESPGKSLLSSPAYRQAGFAKRIPLFGKEGLGEIFRKICLINYKSLIISQVTLEWLER
jgi:hypothetical protein